MKNLVNANSAYVLFCLICTVFLFSCQEEESLDEIINVESKVLETWCDIGGDSCGNSNGSFTLTYSSNFNPNDVNWSILSGNISIVGGQGTNTVSLQLGSNFNGGSVYAIGTGNGGVVCSDSYSISKCTTPPPPACDLSFGGELENGQYLAFSPATNSVLNNVTYKTDIWTNPSNASVSWTKLSSSSPVSWSQSGKNLSFRFYDNNPRSTGGRAVFRLIVSKDGCETISRSFIFCHGDCGVIDNPDA